MLFNKTLRCPVMRNLRSDTACLDQEGDIVDIIFSHMTFLVVHDHKQVPAQTPWPPVLGLAQRMVPPTRNPTARHRQDPVSCRGGRYAAQAVSPRM